MDHFEPITIGKFIELLEKQDKNYSITFDFCDFVPTSFDSYRGFYEQLALGYSDDHSQKATVATLLEKARVAQYQTYTGYKGGSYQMTPETPLWCDNWGRSTSTAIVNVVDCDYYVKIITQHIKY
jgi:hypothetical protein